MISPVSAIGGYRDIASPYGISPKPVERTAKASRVDPQSPQDEAVIRSLQKTDREVRAHEQAHVAAAGAYARGGPAYTYRRGPDGELYAVAGEVQLDTSPVAGDPEATVRKARTIQAAANAPAEPSGQDRAVAAQAAQLEAQARLQALLEEQGGVRGTSLDLIA